MPWANPHGMIDEVSLMVPRHAFSPRHMVRAGEVWRLLQIAAVESSARRGWPSSRYQAEGTGFIVSRMTVRHHRQLSASDDPFAQTWVRDFRRGIISRREIRLLVGAEVVVATTQQWVHISIEKMAPSRASDEMIASFSPHDFGGAPVSLPAFQPATGPSWQLTFPCWHSWMDVLGHVNHPTYVDWCDEAIMQRLAALGADPQGLIPVAEDVRFRRGVQADEVVTVTSQLIGVIDRDAVIEHTISTTTAAASATTVRRLSGGDLALLLGNQPA
jgi:acyl-CoA thioesterase FadM